MIENKIKQVTASINTNLPTNHTQNCKHRVLRKWQWVNSVLGPNTDKQTHNFKAQQPLSSPEL